MQTAQAEVKIMCRCCGKVTEDTYTLHIVRKGEYEDEGVISIPENAAAKLIAHKLENAVITGPLHKCEDGSFGLQDLIGFKTDFPFKHPQR